MMMQERVDAGELLVIVGDRVPAHDAGRTTDAQFLGATGAVRARALRARARAGLPGVPVLLPEGSATDIRLYFEPFAERIELPRRERAQHLAAWAQRYARRLEHYCRKAPYQWFNFFDFWARPATWRTRWPNMIRARVASRVAVNAASSSAARRLTIEEVVSIARRGAPVALSADPAWRARIQRGAEFLRRHLAAGRDRVRRQHRLWRRVRGRCAAWNSSKPCRCSCTRYHGCGMGQHLDDAQTLAVIAARLNSLAYGFSGVRTCCSNGSPI